MNKYAKNGPLISFPYASVLRSRMEPSARLSERSGNICELKTKHLSHRCKPKGCMCESRPGSHSVFSNIEAPKSDGHRLSCRIPIRCTCNEPRMCCSLCLPAKFNSRTGPQLVTCALSCRRLQNFPHGGEATLPTFS